MGWFGAWASATWIVCTVSTLGTFAWALDRWFDERRVKAETDEAAKLQAKVDQLMTDMDTMKNKVGQLDVSLSRKGLR